MKEKVIGSRYLSKVELSILLVAFVAIGVGTSVSAASGWLLGELFGAIAPLLFVSLPGYFMVVYSNRAGSRLKRPWLRRAIAILGAGLIGIGVISVLFYIFAPWVAWILIGVAAYYFYNR